MADLESDVLLEGGAFVWDVIVRVEINHFQVAGVHANQFVDDFVAARCRMRQMFQYEWSHPFRQWFQRSIRFDIDGILAVVHVVIGRQIPYRNVLYD